MTTLIDHYEYVILHNMKTNIIMHSGETEF